MLEMLQMWKMLQMLPRRMDASDAVPSVSHEPGTAMG